MDRLALSEFSDGRVSGGGKEMGRGDRQVPIAAKITTMMRLDGSAVAEGTGTGGREGEDTVARSVRVFRQQKA